MIRGLHLQLQHFHYPHTAKGQRAYSGDLVLICCGGKEGAETEIGV